MYARPVIRAVSRIGPDITINHLYALGPSSWSFLNSSLYNIFHRIFLSIWSILDFVGFHPPKTRLSATPNRPGYCGIRPAQYRSVVSSTVMPLRWICEGNSRRRRALQQPNLMRSAKVGGFNPWGGVKIKDNWNTIILVDPSLLYEEKTGQSEATFF